MVAAPSPLRQALANREIRLAELAWMLGIASENAYLVALFVNAYQLGGIVEVGLSGVARTLPAAVLSPFLAGLADHLPRHRVLLAAHLSRGAAIAGLALTALMGGSLVVLLTLAAIEGVIATLHRAAHMSLLPALASAPEELVASNVVSGAAENVGGLAGPAVGAALVAVAGVVVAFAAAAAAFGAAALTIALVHPATQPPRTRAQVTWRRGLDGIVALREHPSAALVVGMGGVQTFVRGVMTVLLVAAAVELLGLGTQGYGYLQSAIGLGGIGGAVVIGMLAGRIRLSTATLTGLVLWGLPITVIGLITNPVVALVSLVVLGIGNATFDVGLFSLIQRNVPNRSRASVLGALESLVALTVGLGSLVAPLVERLFGLRLSLIGTGLILPLLVLATARAVRLADHAAVVPERQMRLLRGVGIFRPLPLTVVEQLASSLHTVSFEIGQKACVEGEAGDRFFIIAEGAAHVEAGGRRLRNLGPGDSFGEIALLRSVPRTATVCADGRLETFSLEREDFVAAVNGNRLAGSAAEALIGNRLAEDAGRA
jgi:MFS family permease